MSDDGTIKYVAHFLAGPVKDWVRLEQDVIYIHEDGTLGIIRKGSVVPVPVLDLMVQSPAITAPRRRSSLRSSE